MRAKRVFLSLAVLALLGSEAPVQAVEVTDSETGQNLEAENEDMPRTTEPLVESTQTIASKQP